MSVISKDDIRKILKVTQLKKSDIENLSRQDVWYVVFEKLVNKVCQLAGCKEPNLELCKDCRVHIASQNVSYYREMGWIELVKKTVILFKDVDIIATKVKREKQVKTIASHLS